jgi:DNA-binding GntR family transcriptional regulator
VYTREFPGKHADTGGASLPNVIDHDLPVPLHEQLSGILRAKIASREITSRVPSILTLAQEYGVSHRTADHALQTLRDEGLIIAVRGKGFYVTQPRR